MDMGGVSTIHAVECFLSILLIDHYMGNNFR